MDSLRVGVVGCGPIGILHATAVRSSPIAHLIGVCDIDLPRATALARRLGGDVACHAHFDGLLEHGLDAVMVATPDHLHVDVVLAAIAAGCHVFCEKPLATTIEDARRMVDAAASRGLLLGVNHNRRFGFGYRTARRLIDDGKLGPVRLVQFQVFDRTPSPEVARMPEVILTTLLTHHLDLARWFGGEVSRLVISASRRDERGFRLWHEVVLALEFTGGAIGAIVAGYCDGQTRTREQATIVGSQGFVHVDDVTRRATYWSTDPDQTEVFEPSPFQDECSFDATIVRHIHRFLECVAAGCPPPVSGLDGLRGLELLADARRAYADHGPIPPIQGRP